MKYKFGILLLISILVFLSTKARGYEHRLQTIETFVAEPIDLENIAIWVPVAKAGPLINRACTPKNNCEYSYTVPSNVSHTKSKDCPPRLAKLLAESVAIHHKTKLPLTIFNGWQWEYADNLNARESTTYDLGKDGCSWENSWEGILIFDTGSANIRWLDPNNSQEQSVNPENSCITVQTFSSIRIRDGYPQKYQFK